MSLCTETQARLSEDIEDKQIEHKQVIDNYLNLIFGREEEWKNLYGSKEAINIVKDIRDNIFNDVYETGYLIGFSHDGAKTAVRGWSDFLMRNNNNMPINSETIIKSIPSLKKIRSYVIQFRKKRLALTKRFEKNKTLSNMYEAVMPPDVVAFVVDRSGWATKLWNLANHNSKTVQGDVNRYYEPISQKRKDLITTIVTNIKNGINPNTLPYNGVEFQITAERGNKETVLLKSLDDFDKYTDIKNKEYIMTLVAESIADKFFSEIMNGQARYIEALDLGKRNLTKKEMTLLKNKRKNNKRYQHYIKIGDKTYIYMMAYDNKKEGIRISRFSKYTRLGSDNYIAIPLGVIDSQGTRSIKLRDADHKQFVEDFKNGYYRSEEERIFPAMKKVNGEWVNTQVKEFVNFKKMNFDDSIYRNELADLIATSRIQLRKVLKELSIKTVSFEKDIQEIDSKLKEKLSQMGLSHDEVLKKIDSLYQIGDVENRMWRSEEDGKLHSYNVKMHQILNNYFPNQYDLEDMNDILNEALVQITNKLNKAKDEGNEFAVEKYAGIIESINAMLSSANRTDTDNKDNENMILNDARQVHAEARKIIMDGTRIRKDNQVLPDYFRRIFSTYHNNVLVSEYMKSIYALYNTGKYGESAINFIKDRVHQGLNENKQVASFGREWGSYNKISEMLKDTPLLRNIPAIKQRAWGGNQVRRWMLGLAALPSMRYLGASGAIKNNTQLMNTFIQTGGHYLTTAFKEYSNEYWQKVLSQLGTHNLMDMFESILGGSTNEQINPIGDMGFYPTTSIPTKASISLNKILKMGREDFINKGDERLDKYLLQLAGKASGRERNKILYLRKTFWELINLDESQVEKNPENVKRIEGLIKRLSADVAEDKLRRLVTWKLSWFIDKDTKFLTFTGSEKMMRDITAVAHLMYARDKGIPMDEGPDGDVNTGSIAKSIVRKAVDASMFGLGTTSLPKAMEGIGRVMFQYWGYRYYQTRFDYKVVSDFIRSQDYSGLMKVFANPEQIFLKENKGRENEDAVHFARWLSTRFMVSLALSIMAPLMPGVSLIIRKLPITGGMIRGAESPVLSVVLRTMMWMMLGANDDDKDRVMSYWSMFFFPAFIGLITGVIDWDTLF